MQPDHFDLCLAQLQSAVGQVAFSAGMSGASGRRSVEHAGLQCASIVLWYRCQITRKAAQLTINAIETSLQLHLRELKNRQPAFPSRWDGGTGGKGYKRVLCGSKFGHPRLRCEAALQVVRFRA